MDLDIELLIEIAIQKDIEILNEKYRKKLIKRSLTRAESSQLKVSQSELSCSVGYFEDSRGKKLGYRAYTHRAGTKYFDKPGDIPAASLKFISSTS